MTSRQDHTVSVLICGVVRNGGPSLARSLERVADLLDQLPGANAVVATNDNDDTTPQTLSEWQSTGPRRSVLVLDGLIQAYPDRIQRLAAARNAALSAGRASSKKKIDFLLMLDLDGPNDDLSVSSVVDLIHGWSDTWAGIFPVQRQGYYDIFALRHAVWCPRDYVSQWLSASEGRLSPLLTKRRDWLRAAVENRQFRIRPDGPLLEVESAFGGLAIYRGDAVEANWYADRDRLGRRCCEHVSFNERITAAGGRLFVHPGLVNDAPAEHLGPLSGQAEPEWLRGFAAGEASVSLISANGRDGFHGLLAWARAAGETSASFTDAKRALMDRACLAANEAARAGHSSEARRLLAWIIGHAPMHAFDQYFLKAAVRVAGAGLRLRRA